MLLQILLNKHLAQTEALMRGKTTEKAKAELQKRVCQKRGQKLQYNTN